MNNSRWCIKDAWHGVSKRSVSVILALFLVAIVSTSGALLANEVRIWTSADGKHTTIAELVEVDGNFVVLKKVSGGEIRVPISKLSRDDQRYLRGESPLHGSDIVTEDKSDTAPKRSSSRLNTARAVEDEARQAITAADALLVYEFALAEDDLPPRERAKVEDRMRYWADLADKGYVRLGDKWASKEEAKEAKERAKKKIDLAIEMLHLGNGPLAAQALEDASEADPNSTEADFITGILYSYINDDDRSAAASFEKCLKRDPGNVAALNNLAVCQFFIRNFNGAVENWCQAATISPETEVLAENLGCMIAVSSRRNVRVKKDKLDKATEVYGELLAEYGHERPTQLRLRFLLPTRFQVGKSKIDSEGDLITMGSGTGFVVAPNTILTNEHVVEGGENFLIINPENHQERFAATLIAASAKDDLALLRCEEFDAPPVPLCTNLPRRGADIMVLGYPLGTEFGTNLKSTRGSIVALPHGNDELGGMIMYDAVTNPGNSGGPLCDQGGRVVGVVRAVSGAIGGSYGHAIPASTAMEFLRKHVHNVSPDDQQMYPLSWPEVDERVAPSTVLILNRQHNSQLKGYDRGASR